MSRKVLIQMVQPGGVGNPVFGRILNPQDFMDWQEFAHQHAEVLQSALLLHNAPTPQTNGLAYALPGGLQFSVAAGFVFTPAGRAHDTLPPGEATVLNLAAADPANPRIDLVYALLETDVEAELELNPFRRIRSEAELESGADPYIPTELNAPTQGQTRATIQVRAGAPAAVPAAPAAGLNEVPLYHVMVGAGAVNLVVGNVTDVRSQARSLYDALALIDALNANFNEQVDDRVGALLADTTSVVKAYNDGAGTLGLTVPPEFVQDVVGAFLTSGLGVTVNYDDAAGTFTISMSVEDMQDQVDAFLAVANGVSKNHDDAGNILTLSLDNEYVQDLVAALLQVTANTGLTLVYNDVANTLTLAGAAASGAAMGMMSVAHFNLVNGATNAATADALVKRDANADAIFRRLVSNIATGTAPLGVTSTTEVPNLNANMVQGWAAANIGVISHRYQSGSLNAALASATLCSGSTAYLINCMVWCVAGGGGNATVLISWTDPNGNAYVDRQIATTGLGGGGNAGNASLYIVTNTGNVTFRVTYAGPGNYSVRFDVIRC